MTLIWNSSDWDRPLSPLRRSRHQSAHTNSPRQQNQGPKDEGHSFLAYHPPLRPPRLAAREEVAKALSQTPLQQYHGSAHLQKTQDARESLKLAVHYVGLAKGELGVLSKRQAVPPRPATAPCPVGKSPATCHWIPTYSLQSGVSQHHVAPPFSHVAAGTGQQDIRHVLDDPVGRVHVMHDVFASRALQPTQAKLSPRGGARHARWMRAPPTDAPLATKNLTTYSRPRLLSAGGFPGWKLSRDKHSSAAIARPNIAQPLRPTTSPATLHSTAAAVGDPFPPRPADTPVGLADDDVPEEGETADNVQAEKS